MSRAAETTRRALLGGAGLAAVAVAAGATPGCRAGQAATPTPFRIAEAREHAARRRFNNLPSGLERRDPAAYRRVEAAYLASVDAVDSAPVADWQEFADAFDFACDGGASLPTEALVYKLRADALRLAGRA